MGVWSYILRLIDCGGICTTSSAMAQEPNPTSSDPGSMGSQLAAKANLGGESVHGP